MLRRHHNVGAAVRFAQRHRHLGHRGLTVGKQQLRTVSDDAAILLTSTRKESRNVDERDDRNIESVAEPHEPRGFARGVDVQHARHILGLVGNDTNGLSVETGKAGDDVLCKRLVGLEEVAVVDHRANHLIHVVGLVGAVGHDLVEAVFQTADGVVAHCERSILHVVLGHEAQQLVHQRETILLGVDRKVGHTALGGVHRRAAELLLSHVFTRDGLHDLWPGEKHVARVLLHDNEVGERRRVDRTAGRRAEDGADLGNHPACHHVALEDFGVTRECVHTLLNTCAARVVYADHGSALPHCHVHHLADLLGHSFAQRAAVDGKVLRKDIDQPSVHRAVSGHDAVAEVVLLLHAEVHAAVLDEHVELFETALVEEHVDSFACSEFALGVLPVDSLLAASQGRLFAPFDQLTDLFLNITHIDWNY